MKFFEIVSQVKDSAEESEQMEDIMREEIPIELSQDQRQAIADVSKYKKVIIFGLQLLKIIFGGVVDKILDKAILFVEIVL